MYTVISYRENGQVFRGGYCEGRTDSQMFLGTTDDREQAVILLARALTREMVSQDQDLNKNYDFTAASEIFLGINGYFGSSHFVGEDDDLLYDQYITEEMEMFAQARAMASEEYRNKKLESDRAKSQDRDAAARREEAAERAQLAKLQAKYGVSGE